MTVLNAKCSGSRSLPSQGGRDDSRGRGTPRSLKDPPSTQTKVHFQLPRDHQDRDTRQPGTPESGIHLISRRAVDEKAQKDKSGSTLRARLRSRSPAKRENSPSRSPIRRAPKDRNFQHQQKQKEANSQAKARDQGRDEQNLPWWLKRRMKKRN